MSTFNEQMQGLFRRYQAENGIAGPTTLRDVANWAIANNHWKPQPGALIRQCVDQFARALRDEYYTDAQGRRVRTKHVVRLPKREKGEQASMWDDIRTASRGHMEVSLQQRRQGIVADCHQLKTDADSFNDNGNTGEPIQLIFDFNADLDELDSGFSAA